MRLLGLEGGGSLPAELLAHVAQWLDLGALAAAALAQPGLLGFCVDTAVARRAPFAVLETAWHDQPFWRQAVDRLWRRHGVVGLLPDGTSTFTGCGVTNRDWLHLQVERFPGHEHLAAWAALLGVREVYLHVREVTIRNVDELQLLLLEFLAALGGLRYALLVADESFKNERWRTALLNWFKAALRRRQR